MISVLLITHQTSRTGAPFSILLIFEEILKKNKNITLDVVTLSSEGDLLEEFENLGRNFFFLEKYYNYKKTVYEQVLSIFKLRSYNSPLEILTQEISRNKYDIIYANTIVSIPFACLLKTKTNAKIIAHIHELEYAMNECLTNFKNYDKNIDQYIVPSILNKRLLEEKYTIDPNKIEICREAAQSPKSFFKKNTDKTSFNVYMCGTANWRKGEDLFLILANETVIADNTIHFYWIGQQPQNIKEKNKVELDKLATRDNIHFIDETKEIYNYIAKMDCFVLTSREDPFPLAAIEAGMSGLPIICFSEGNGIQEVIKNKGCIIDYLDLEGMKNAIIDLKNNRIKYEEVSKNNLETFSKFDAKNASKIVLNNIKEISTKNETL